MAKLLGQVMTIQVNIGEAKTRLSELVAASERGETVAIARAGKVVAQLVAPVGGQPETRAQAVERRRAVFKLFGELYRASGVTDPDDVALRPSMTDEEVEERWQRKFGPAA